MAGYEMEKCDHILALLRQIIDSKIDVLAVGYEEPEIEFKCHECNFVYFTEGVDESDLQPSTPALRHLPKPHFYSPSDTVTIPSGLVVFRSEYIEIMRASGGVLPKEWTVMASENKFSLPLPDCDWTIGAEVMVDENTSSYQDDYIENQDD